jgi:glycosyltransferase involved in cell wall biosynthesis
MVDSMRVLELSTESSVQVSFILPLAEHLRKQGHEVVLACSDDPGEAGQSFVEPLRKMGFEVLVLPIRRTVSPWFDVLSVIKLNRYLRQRKFDIVHTQTAKAGMVGRLAARLAGVPVIIYTAHAFPFHEFLSPWRMRFYAFLEKQAARFCDLTVVDSEAVRSRGIEMGVGSEATIKVIPMGIDTDQFDPAKYSAERLAVRDELGLAPDRTVVGSIARLVPSKGLDCLLHAVSKLAQTHPNLQCLIAGDGPLREDLVGLARKLGIEDRVVFAGYRRDVARVLAAIDVFVSPTHREGFGVAVAEAMAMEVPVITSRIPPLTQIVTEGETGLFAEVGNADEFAAAIETLLISPQRRTEIGKAARRHVISHFSLTGMCQAHEQLFLDYHRRVSQHSS